MDRIEAAERRYRQIVPVPVRAWGDVLVRELGVWLRDDVAPLVGEYVARAKFRDAADWPIRAFRLGADAPARRQVDETAAALTRHARLLRTALRSPRVAAAITTSLPPLRLTDEDVVLDGSGARPTHRTTREVGRLPVLTAQVESIARPFWRDLVDPADYLEPRCGWLYREAPAEHPSRSDASGAVARTHARRSYAVSIGQLLMAAA